MTEAFWCYLRLSQTSPWLQTIASNLFASSIFPYAGFLYHLQKSKKAPGLMLFGFYFLLVFVFATIPAGIYGESPIVLLLNIGLFLSQTLCLLLELGKDECYCSCMLRC